MDDRKLYEDAERSIAAATVDEPDRYNLAKNDVIDRIYARAFGLENG